MAEPSFYGHYLNKCSRFDQVTGLSVKIYPNCHLNANVKICSVVPG